MSSPPLAASRFTLASILALALLAPAGTTARADAALQLALPGLQAPRDPDVDGVRLVLLHGENARVSGVDLGFAAISEAAVQSGLTLNLGLSIVHHASSGSPWALVNVHRGSDRSLNVACLNSIETLEAGGNVGFLNITARESGFDLGGLNLAESAGTQLGMLNVAREIHGVQIGLLNFASNGFLPVFPFFNVPSNVSARR